MGARRLRRADGGGQQVGRRSLGRAGLPGGGRPSALARSLDFGARTERMAIGVRQYNSSNVHGQHDSATMK